MERKLTVSGVDDAQDRIVRDINSNSNLPVF